MATCGIKSPVMNKIVINMAVKLCLKALDIIEYVRKRSRSNYKCKYKQLEIKKVYSFEPAPAQAFLKGLELCSGFLPQPVQWSLPRLRPRN